MMGTGASNGLCQLVFLNKDYLPPVLMETLDEASTDLNFDPSWLNRTMCGEFDLSTGMYGPLSTYEEKIVHTTISGGRGVDEKWGPSDALSSVS
jgi:hypothetical protein